MTSIRIVDCNQIFGLLKEKYHLDLNSYALASLERRVNRFLNLYGVPDIRQLETRLMSDKNFFDVFVKEITVNTTEMFRDPGAWKALREEVFPLIAEAPGLRIWHAGCSSGEEVYSMAILLTEENLIHKVNIVASDINTEVIRTASEGRYPGKNFQLNNDNYIKAGGKGKLSDYYDTEDGWVRMKAALRKNVRFLKHDLSSGKPFSKFDLILCRNVMIYFNKDLQERVFDIFSVSLFKKGFIAIGKKESMAYYSGMSRFTEFNAGEKIYRLN